MFYDKKIRYLDYYKNSERMKNCGFARTEAQGDNFRLEMSLKGLLGADAEAVEVYLQCGDREIPLGQLAIRNGCGEFRYSCAMKGGSGKTEIKYDEISGIRLPLGQTAEVMGKWNTGCGRVYKENREAQVIAAAERVGREKAENAETTGKSVLQEKTVQELPKPEAVRTEEGAEAGQREHSMELLPLLEDKWLQLVSIYPRIKPFRDEREYLSISPADFVVFAGESYRSANNSFLLHGYYNYRHLILTRVERRGEILYYVGVPGSYYVKEKQVAVMFGFESFECAEEPAQDGDFGYYMMRVKL